MAPILWLIGVDQKSGVVGAEHKELANWYNRVRSHFDELAPDFTDVNVPIGDQTVVALLFNTERRPFVVRTQGGSITHEVPWRGETSTRSAKRSDLVNLLHRIRRLPQWEAINGILTVEPNPQPRMLGNNLLFQLRLKLFVEPEDDARLCVPFHRCVGTVDFPDFGNKPRLRSFRLSPYDQESVNIKGSNTELVIEGPGMVILEAEAESHYGGLLPHTRLRELCDCLMLSEETKPA